MVLHEAFSRLAALSKDQGKYQALLADLLVQVGACVLCAHVCVPVAQWVQRRHAACSICQSELCMQLSMGRPRPTPAPTSTPPEQALHKLEEPRVLVRCRQVDRALVEAAIPVAQVGAGWVE